MKMIDLQQRRYNDVLIEYYKLKNEYLKLKIKVLKTKLDK